MMMGALAFATGPRLVPAFRTSVTGRGVGVLTAPARTAAGGLSNVGGAGACGREAGSPPWRRLAGPAGVGVVLAMAAGLVAGLTRGSGPVALMALVAAMCVLVLMVWRPEVMLLAVAAFPWLDWAARRALGGIGPAWDDAFLILSVVLLAWCVVVLRRWELWTVPIALPTLLALGAAIGSVVVRDVPGDVALFALRVLFQPLLFYFVGFLFPKNTRWVRWVVGVFLLAGVALALHGLYQYATHAPMPARWVDVSETNIGTRAYSILGNPNGLGAFLLLGTLVSLSLALARGLRRLQRLAMAAVFVIQLGGVAVTFSRGAWIGLGAGTLALLIMAYRRYLAPLAAAGVVGWFVVPGAFVNRLAFAFSSTYITKSAAAGRLYVWKMSLGHIAAHPWFGVGLGTFGGTSAVTFGYGRLWVDNFYLQLGAEGGLLLLAFFLWILLRTAKGLVKGHGTTRDPYVRALTAGVFGAFIAVAVANATASVWETLVVGVGFWFLAGLATSAALHEGGER
jgi:O-antigen ligase